MFRFADVRVVERTWEEAGFEIDHIEELEVPVVEAPDGRGIARWILGFNGPHPEHAREPSC
ncbi:MAG: hypothetical protein WBV82_05580 [Myxococcaceae bacterium]